jgi:hypothetical protein
VHAAAITARPTINMRFIIVTPGGRTCHSWRRP